MEILGEFLAAVPYWGTSNDRFVPLALLCVDLLREPPGQPEAVLAGAWKVVCMVAVERGLLRLDDPVEMYIPEWENMQVYVSGSVKDGDVQSDAPSTPSPTSKVSGVDSSFVALHPCTVARKSRSAVMHDA